MINLKDIIKSWNVYVVGVHLEISAEGAAEQGTHPSVVDSLAATHTTRVRFIQHLLELVKSSSGLKLIRK